MVILYFGVIAEILGKEKEDKDFVYTNVADLLVDLTSNNKRLINVSFRIAVNQVIVNDQFQLKAGDVVAILPPFAGG